MTDDMSKLLHLSDTAMPATVCTQLLFGEGIWLKYLNLFIEI